MPRRKSNQTPTALLASSVKARNVRQFDNIIEDLAKAFWASEAQRLTTELANGDIKQAILSIDKTAIDNFENVDIPTTIADLIHMQWLLLKASNPRLNDSGASQATDKAIAESMDRWLNNTENKDKLKLQPFTLEGFRDFAGILYQHDSWVKHQRASNRITNQQRFTRSWITAYLAQNQQNFIAALIKPTANILTTEFWYVTDAMLDYLALVAIANNEEIDASNRDRTQVLALQTTFQPVLNKLHDNLFQQLQTAETREDILGLFANIKQLCKLLIAIDPEGVLGVNSVNPRTFNTRKIIDEMLSKMDMANTEDWCSFVVLLRDAELELDENSKQHKGIKTQIFFPFVRRYFDKLSEVRSLGLDKQSAVPVVRGRTIKFSDQSEEPKPIVKGVHTYPLFKPILNRQNVNFNRDEEYPTEQPIQIVLSKDRVATKSSLSESQANAPVYKGKRKSNWSLIIDYMSRIRKYQLVQVKKDLNDARENNNVNALAIEKLDERIKKLENPDILNRLLSKAYVRESKAEAIKELKSILESTTAEEAADTISSWERNYLALKTDKSMRYKLVTNAASLLALHGKLGFFYRKGTLTSSQRCLNEVKTLADLQRLTRPQLYVELAYQTWQLKQGIVTYKKFLETTTPMLSVLTTKPPTQAELQTRDRWQLDPAQRDNTVDALPNEIAEAALQNKYLKLFNFKPADPQDKVALGTALYELAQHTIVANGKDSKSAFTTNIERASDLGQFTQQQVACTA